MNKKEAQAKLDEMTLNLSKFTEAVKQSESAINYYNNQIKKNSDSLDENNCTTLGLCEFARRYCDSCPDCVVMDLSYEEAESYLKKKK